MVLRFSVAGLTPNRHKMMGLGDSGPIGENAAKSPEDVVTGRYMSFETVPSLARLFFDQASQRLDRPFLWDKKSGAWQSRSYDRVAADIRRLARGLIAL